MIAPEGDAPARALAYSPDSAWLAVAQACGTIRVLDGYGSAAVSLASKPIPDRCGLSWNSTSTELFVGSTHAALRIGVPGGRAAELRLSGEAVPNVCDLVHLSDALLAFATNTRLQLFDLKQGKPLVGSRVEPRGIRALAVHRASKQLAWTTGEQRLRIWPITSRDVADAPIGKPTGPIAISPDGSTIAVGVDWTVRLFAKNSRTSNVELLGHKGRVTGLAFTADGRHLYSCSYDRTVRGWDLAAKAERSQFDPQLGPLTCLAVSPDGTRLAVGGSEGPFAAFDLE